MDVKICAIQCAISHDPLKNLKNAALAFQKAAKSKCQIICFPEMFLTGPIKPANYDAAILQKAKSLFSSLSKRHRMASIMGSVMERRGKCFFNTSFVFDEKGKLLGHYRKIHLTKGEKKRFSAGKKTPIFRTRFGTIGIQICRDLLYPKLTRDLMHRGAQVIFCPSFWAAHSTQYSATYNRKYFGAKEPREVDMLSSARAIENAAFFVYVNAAGKFSKGKSSSILLGRTQIASPFYGTIARLGHNRIGLLVAKISLSIVKDARKIYRTAKP